MLLASLASLKGNPSLVIRHIQDALVVLLLEFIDGEEGVLIRSSMIPVSQGQVMLVRRRHMSLHCHLPSCR